ncbi:unnamed protein product [Trifolium pratense]|uniref:Uncharacterized protein n=1 Tax=Trifolium pratense TaxID=57577 RepID=A0ACB0LKM1_TRIPR|nr:unnamed protein product [Trifolium pratense]
MRYVGDVKVEDTKQDFCRKCVWTVLHLKNSAESYGYGFEAFRLQLCISASSGNDDGIVQACLQISRLFEDRSLEA